MSPSSVIDPLAEALPILQAKYGGFNALNYKAGDHLSDLIARSNGKITLVPPDVMGPVPIITATLPDNIIYWRLSSFTPKTNWDELGTELQDASTRNPYGGAILDLRGNAGPAGIAEASQIIDFFALGDESLFKFLPLLADGHKFGGSVIPDHSFHGPIVVLINHQTTGVAEVLAARLKADGALLVGRETSGKGAVFKDYKLSSGQVLRYVAAHVNLADGTDLWGQPVVPDISIAADEHTEKAALTLIRDGHIDDVIGESPERHRLNEATLVQGQDPEWDAYLDSLEQKPFLLSLPVIHDTVLISALDSLKAIRLSQRSLPTQVQADPSPPIPSSIQ